MKRSIELNRQILNGTLSNGKLKRTCYDILILDDHESDSELLKTYLQREEKTFRHIRCFHQKNNYISALSKHNFDLIIADFELGGYDAFEAIAIRNKIAPATPIIVVSGVVGDEKAVKLIREGASDFLLKENAAERLAQAVIRAIGEGQERELRKLAEKELNESLRRYRTLFETSLDGIMIAEPDENGKVIDANESLCNLLNYSIEELKQMRRNDFFRGQNDGLNKLLQQRENGQYGIFKGELSLVAKDKTKLPVEITSRLIKFEDGEERTYSVIRDIRSKKEFEQRKNWNQKKQNLLRDLAQIINQKSTFEEALEACLEQINNFLSWSVAHVYIRDSKENQAIYKSLGIWHTDNTAETEKFVKKSSGFEFKNFQGYIGKVAKQQELKWFNPCEEEEKFLRNKYAKEAGLCSAVIVPVIIHNETEAVLEFYRNVIEEPKSYIKETLYSVAEQLSRLIERKQYIEKLEDEKERYRLLAHNSTDMICRHTTDGNYIYISPAVQQLLGYRTNELIGESPYDYIHPDDLEKVSQVNTKIFETTENQGLISCRMKCKDGSWKWVESSTKAISSPETGEVREFQTTTRDITERKQYECRMRRQTELNETIINSLPGLFFMISEDQKMIRVNDKFKEILGYSDDEISEMSPVDFVCREDQHLAEISIEQAFYNESIEVEIRMETAHGRIIPFLMSGEVNKIEGEKYLLGTGVDIEKRWKIENELETEKEFINKALNSLPGLFYMLDEENNFVWANQNLIDEFGYSFEEIQKMHPLDFYDVDRYEEVIKAMEKALLDGESNLVTQMVKKNGDKPHYFLTGTRFTNQGKNYILGTGIDITEKKELESLLDEAHKLARIGAWEWNLDTNDLSWSPMTREIHEMDAGYTPEVKEALNHFKMGENRNRIHRVVREAIEDGTPFDEELKIITAKGNERWIRTIGNPEFKDGKCVRLYGSFQDIHEVKRTEQELKDSNREKEILLMEIHHRVKNNLALVSGILQLQSFQAEDEDLSYQLSNSQSRIQSIAMIHELLYETKNFSQINLDKNLHKLINYIADTFGGQTKINFDLRLQKIPVDVNLAIPCALIVNEVLTNIYKHAFKGQKSGNVGVRLTEKNKQIKLRITDNGVGLPENFNYEESNSLGLKLVQTLKVQLNGHISLKTAGSKTYFELNFHKESDTKGAGSYFIR